MPLCHVQEARRECAEELRRLLRGDPGLVEEIERRHAQMAGTELEAFLKATAPEPGAVLEEVSCSCVWLCTCLLHVPCTGH